MNTTYLANLIADKLHTLVCVYDSDKKPLFIVNKLYDMKEYAEFMPSTEKFLLDLSDTPHGFPLLSSTDKTLVFATVPADDKIYLIGPVRFFMKVDIRHNLTLNRQRDTKIKNIKQVEVSELLFYVLLLSNLHYDKTISELDILTYNCNNTTQQDVSKNYYNILFHNRENGTTHNSYSQEERMLKSIETGNLEMLALCREEEQQGEFGVMAASEERSVKNVCISAITLISRAAIRGGVHPELAFSLCDSYVMEVERIVQLADLKPLVEEAKVKFATMVQELKSRQPNTENISYHPLVNKSKDYIYSHLHEKISLNTIAAELNVNPNYLSTLFQKCENISFSEFVMQRKIDLAKTMLIYSSFSYSEIAFQLGFSSQSHFGKNFLAITSMTPKQYRNHFKAENSSRK